MEKKREIFENDDERFVMISLHRLAKTGKKSPQGLYMGEKLIPKEVYEDGKADGKSKEQIHVQNQSYQRLQRKKSLRLAC